MALLDGNSNKPFDLIGLLFGNIDNNGHLEENFIDDNEDLSPLNIFGFDSMVENVISHDEVIGESEIYYDEDDIIINEEVIIGDSYCHSDYDSNSLVQNFTDLCEEICDSQVENSKSPAKEEIVDINTNNESNEYQKITSPIGTPEDKENNCPFSSILPPKYKNTDVTKLFPEFRRNKVLRFNKLFGPGDEKNLPNVWRQAQKISKNTKKCDDQSSDAEQEDKTIKKRGWVMNYGPDPDPDQCASDDELKLLAPTVAKVDVLESKHEKKNEKPDSSFEAWRFGPAKFWFDMMKVPETGGSFDYGFKLAKKDESIRENKDEKIIDDDIDDDAFLMVTQLRWEDNVIWDAKDIAHKVTRTSNNTSSSAGWIPSTINRKVFNDVTDYKSQLDSKDKNFSILPMENPDLVYGKWEDEVIWDAENMTKIPEPKILTLDLNDENIIFRIPDEISPTQCKKNENTQRKSKTPLPYAKKSKTILSQQGLLNFDEAEEEEEEEETESTSSKMFNQDPFNISNDVYYMSKQNGIISKSQNGGGLIQHSTPVIELSAPFIQTYMNSTKLRNFHRPSLRRYSHGLLSHPRHHPVCPLTKYIQVRAAMRERERAASGGGDVFFMRKPEDLSGKDSELILIEYTEEHPPLMNQVGMCLKIKNYYKRKANKDSELPSFKYGETKYAHSSPFLGSLAPGQCIQAIENNMYRAPIYEHKVSPTDFLIIRTRDRYYIREVNSIFTAGQECPLYPVPAPNSKLAVKFSRDFLLVYIYRLFWKSSDNPRRIKIEDIKKAFPLYSEGNIRKRLKACANFKRTGMYSNWWVIKPEFRLPSEEEIQEMVTPEQCCAYFSMKAAEQRLKDAGYGDKFLLTNQYDDDENFQMKIDDEIKVAPWNTTAAYIQAMEGKCLLQLTGPADPTGCGEGFSYVRMPNKPIISKSEQEQQTKKQLIGTDADLRRLRLPAAKIILRKFGVPDSVIDRLGRWEIVDLVRTCSTAKVKAGEEQDSKFSRGNRFSVVEYQERYKEEAQRIFNLQNSLLGSAEVLSTDEDDSSDDNSDIEEMGKNIENILTNKITTKQITFQQEEQERKELKQMLMDESSQKSDSKSYNNSNSSQSSERVLKIHRTYQDSEGKEYTRVEYVRNSAVIDLYLKLKNTNDKKVVNDFLSLNDEQKEEKRKEKRRLQEKLRRIKRQQERASKNPYNNKIISSGQSHNIRDEPSSMRQSPVERSSVFNTSCSEKQEKIAKQIDYSNDNNHDLVKVDGTKLKFSTKLIKQIQAENGNDSNTSYRTDKSTISENRNNSKKRRRNNKDDIDYHGSITFIKPAKRRQTDPVISVSLILEKILNELKRIPGVEPFLFPVNKKLVKDYYKIIKNPMDLQTIRENIREYKYESREKFLDDMNLLVQNSSLYNGPAHGLTLTAQRILEVCGQKLKEKDESLMRLEKAINPFMGDNNNSKLAFILEDIMTRKLKSMAESKFFLNFKKSVKNNNIKTPMDLNMITRKISLREYHNRYEFLHDIKLILENSTQANSSYMKEAELLVKVCEESLNEYEEYLTQIEHNIINKNSYWLEPIKNTIIPSPSENVIVSENGSANSKSDENEFVDVIGDVESLTSVLENNMNIIQEQFENISENFQIPETKFDELFSGSPTDAKKMQDFTVNTLNLLDELEISSEEEIEQKINQEEQSFDMITGEIWF